jgi:hypothetical protein
MATRTTVETKITAINDRGNNTAVEVRDVLTELLNYTENQTFHIFSAAPINSTQNNTKLFFSIKGTKGETANMTIMIKPLLVEPAPNQNDSGFIIPFNQAAGMFTEANFDLLAPVNGNGIIPLFEEGNYLTYLLPVIGNTDIKEVTLLITMIRTYQTIKNSLVLSILGIRNTSISTSISMHYQKFDEPLFIIRNPGSTGGTGLTTGPRGRGTENNATDDISLEKLFNLNFK